MIERFFVDEYFVVRWADGPSKGKVAQKTSRNGYATVRASEKVMMAHRVVYELMVGKIPSGMDIDHINHNKLDNNPSNLRCVTRSENMRNMKKTSNNTSGFTRVTFNKSKGKWQCQAQIDGKYKYLGLYDDLEKAISARRKFNIDNGFHENHGKTLKANA